MAHEGIVLVSSGTYLGSGNKDLSFGGYNIKLRSISGASTTIIDLEGSKRFLGLTGGETFESWLDGFTIRNGHMTQDDGGSHGGAVYLSGSQLWIKNCVLEKGYALYGGALGVESGQVRVTDSRISGNDTYNSGGAYYGQHATADFENVIFENNSSRNNGSAIYHQNSTLNGKKVRFLNNRQTYASSSYRGCIYSYSSTLNLENALFNYNWSHGDYSDIYADSGSRTNLNHVTILNGVAKNRRSCYFTHNTVIRNSILSGSVSWNEAPSANNNCVTADWSSYGNGNITSDPLLTVAGYLKAGSPCIDAGSSDGASSVDIDGVARPYGTAADMGCQEFKDSDGDGIPDNVETAAGLNPNEPQDAAGDLDNDGLTNIQEYLAGTSLSAEDTDGDGTDDFTEVNSGYNPILKTRIIHVDASRPNDEGDGLSPQTAKLTLQGALSIASSGSDNVILVMPGTYSGSLNRGLSINANAIKIYSLEGANVTKIDLTAANQFLSISNIEKKDCRLSGFTIINGNGRSPVISVNNGGLDIQNCIFKNHSTAKDLNNYFYYNSPGILNVSSGDLSLREVELSDNNLDDGNYVLYATGSRIDMSKVRVTSNNSGSKDLIYLQNTALNMVNSLVIRNNTRSTGSIFRGYDESSSVRGINCSFAYNTNGLTDGFNVIGHIDLLNCIVMEKIQTGTRLLNYCCSAEDYTNLGEGNLVEDPLLTSGGYLKPDSPCIDAGRNEGAPDDDIIGTPRAVGEDVDIGCEEFADLNNNGISDYYEAICGGELAPDGDADGDGLTNLQEYQLGTNAQLMDTDGDGMPDGWEVTHGFNPLDKTDALEDMDGDGLLNVEEYEAGTNPRNIDTDGDGRSDYWEVKEAFSDPNVSDFDGNEQLVETITGNSFVSNTSWEADGTTAFARNRSGEIEYTFPITQAGTYQIELEVQQHISNAATDEFQISCYINGGISNTKLVKLGEDGTGKVRYFTPMLTVGTHTVKFVWLNVYRNSVLQINRLKVFALTGTDSDGNGIPDWAETRLDKMSELVLPATSKTSPVCVEGANASFVEQISISGYYVPAGGTSAEPEIKRAALNRWYTNLPLNPAGDNTITVNVSYQNNAKTVSKQIIWETTDITTQSSITIRKNDSLRLMAALPVDYSGTYTISVEGQEFTLNKGESTPYQFVNAGEIPVTVSWTPSVGAPETHGMTVKVVSGTFNGEIVCFANTSREWRNPDLGAEPVVDYDRNIQFTDNGLRGSSRTFTLMSPTLGKSYVTARLGKDGPILDSSSITVIEASSHVSDGYHRVVEDFGDGTLLYDGYIVVDQVVPGLEIEVVLWGSDTTFDDGSRRKRFTADQFDANGELHYNVIAGRYFSTCQSIYLYQDGVMLKQLQ